MLKSYSYFCSLLQKDVLSSCTFNHYKCCCKKTKNTSQGWIKIYFTNKYILSLREEANVTGAVLYPVETTYTGIFPSRSMNGAGCAQPPHQPAPAQVCTCWAHIRGCSEPQLRPLLFDCRELKGAKKRCFTVKAQHRVALGVLCRPPAAVPLSTGHKVPSVRVTSCKPRVLPAGPATGGDRSRGQQDLLPPAPCPVRGYLCSSGELCAQAVRAMPRHCQMLHLPAKHP